MVVWFAMSIWLKKRNSRHTVTGGDRFQIIHPSKACIQSSRGATPSSQASCHWAGSCCLCLPSIRFDSIVGGKCQRPKWACIDQDLAKRAKAS